MNIVEGRTENFELEVLEVKGSVLVDFYADWCGPCKMIAPLLEQIAKENPEMKVVKVNIDEYPEVAQQYQVMSIPTLIGFKNGTPGKPMVGAGSKDAILNLMR